MAYRLNLIIIIILLLGLVCCTESFNDPEINPQSEEIIVRDSIQDVLARLDKRITSLKTEAEDRDKRMATMEKNEKALKTEAAAREAKLSSAISKITILENEIHHLKSDKIKQSLLPGGYSDYTVEDLQWSSLHMAAAAACRGSTASGGSGVWANRVMPRNAKQTCHQICASSPEKLVCDAAVSLTGYMGRAKSHNSIVGLFYNYGCATIGWSYREEEMDRKISFQGFVGYCCCRKA